MWGRDRCASGMAVAFLLTSWPCREPGSNCIKGHQHSCPWTCSPGVNTKTSALKPSGRSPLWSQQPWVNSKPGAWPAESCAGLSGAAQSLHVLQGIHSSLVFLGSTSGPLRSPRCSRYGHKHPQFCIQWEPLRKWWVWGDATWTPKPQH